MTQKTMTVGKLRAKARKEVDKLAKVKKVSVMTSIGVIVKKLLVVMKEHIGAENRVTKVELFKMVFGVSPDDLSVLQSWICWEFIRSAMHRCRQRTKCFIVSQASGKKDGVWYYWVANGQSDFFIYRDNIERNIKAMRRMVVRCEKSVSEGWHRQEWKYED